MTTGEKIKSIRKQKKLTQAELADGYMTRAMISYIESGTAKPTIEVLKHISEKLDTPIAYFLSETDELSAFIKSDKLPKIKSMYKLRQYEDCIKMLEKLGDADDEIALLLSDCYMKHGRKLLMNGQLLGAEASFEKALINCKKTIYNTKLHENKIPMYLAICKNIHAPLLEFDPKEFEDGLKDDLDLEFYKYVTLDYDYPYKTKLFALHIQAKKLIKENNIHAALDILIDIVEKKRYDEYNAYAMFWIYFDMENAYRQIFDFENAYRYASKRISLIEGFKT